MGGYMYLSNGPTSCVDQSFCSIELPLLLCHLGIFTWVSFWVCFIPRYVFVHVTHCLDCHRPYLGVKYPHSSNIVHHWYSKYSRSSASPYIWRASPGMLKLPWIHPVVLERLHSTGNYRTLYLPKGCPSPLKIHNRISLLHTLLGFWLRLYCLVSKLGRTDMLIISSSGLPATDMDYLSLSLSW